MPLNVACIGRCKEYFSIEGQELFHAHLRVLVLLIVKNPTMTSTCKIAIKALFLYLNVCLHVMLNSLSCSFTSISLHTNWVTKSVISVPSLISNTVFFFVIQNMFFCVQTLYVLKVLWCREIDQTYNVLCPKSTIQTFKRVADP